ncbi:hypothetical protein M3Y99_01141600 [Aphelenchoides fujianensis]|nr:hypothetical protein M3Y99_01141600 [Aphelenchoides fujianensis]
MEMAVVKRKPRMRAAVRDGLNRFHLADAMETDETKGAAQLVRLAAIFCAHLESIRRTARGIKFQWTAREWRLRMGCGLGSPKIDFPIDQTEMIAIIKLLAVPVYLKFVDPWSRYEEVDWKELHQIGKYVNGLGVRHGLKSSDLCLFIGSVASRLKMLNSTWSVLAQLPPLDLKRARLYGQSDDFNALNRHNIRRLDMPSIALEHFSRLQRNQAISASIKALGITHIRNWMDFPYDSIEGFARRFPSLEDLHISCKIEEDVLDLNAYFTELWAKCLEIRDRLHVAGLKRLFLTIKHDCLFTGTKTDWFEKLKYVEPFDKATSTIDHVNECIRMFLKHNEPRGAKPTFILIKGEFCWSMHEEEGMEMGPHGDQMDDENEGDNQAIDEGDLEDEMNDGGDD